MTIVTMDTAADVTMYDPVALLLRLNSKPSSQPHGPSLMAARSRSPRRAVCSTRVPTVQHPRSDLATPVGGAVSETSAARLRQRARRERLAESDDRPALLDFPWNIGCRAFVKNTTAARKPALDRAGCAVCETSDSRLCICGAAFADLTCREKLTSFVRFFRSSSTPVLSEDDPEDQRLLLTQVSRVRMSAAPGSADMYRCIVRFAAIAALSGRPDVMTELSTALCSGGTDAAVQTACAAICGNRPFFRGGQAHGSLSTEGTPSAIGDFCVIALGELANQLQAWSVGVGPPRVAAIRAFFTMLRTHSSLLGAGDYWQKRFVEIVLLAGLRSGQAFQASPADVDSVADLWPLGNGTKAAVRLIFPGLPPSKLHQALRVLQRSLGGGTRKVPIVRISAMLCFWSRALGGTLPWPVPLP